MIRSIDYGNDGPVVAKFCFTPLSRLRIVVDVIGFSLICMVVSFLWLYELYQRAHVRFDELSIGRWSIIAVSLCLTFLFTRWFSHCLSSCRRSEWFAARFLYNSRRIVRLSPWNKYESCRWSDLEQVVGGVRIIGKFRSILEVPEPTTLVFKNGKEIELIPEGIVVFKYFRPLLESAADASGHGSPLFEVAKQLKEDKRIKNSPILKMVSTVWRKFGR